MVLERLMLPCWFRSRLAGALARELVDGQAGLVDDHYLSLIHI